MAAEKAQNNKQKCPDPTAVGFYLPVSLLQISASSEAAVSNQEQASLDNKSLIYPNPTT